MGDLLVFDEGHNLHRWEMKMPRINAQAFGTPLVLGSNRHQGTTGILNSHSRH